MRNPVKLGNCAATVDSPELIIRIDPEQEAQVTRKKFTRFVSKRGV